MSNRLASLHRTLRELRRRHVYRMAGGYTVVAWVVLQVGDVFLPAFMAPDWVMSVLVVLAIMGLPVVVVLTWIYDLTPEGVQRTPPEEDGAETAAWSWNWRWIDYLIIAVLLIILFVLLTRQNVFDPSGGVPARTGSVAVLPLTDLSPDSDYRYFSDGLSEALMEGLGNIPGLQVAASTSAFAFRDTELGAREVARALNVEALLEGSVRKAGEQLRINLRLIDGNSGRRLWSESFTAGVDDIFQVQDSIARAVASSFRIRHLGDMDSVLAPTGSQAAYEEYLQGRGRLRQAGTAESIEEALAHFRRALEIDPDFTLARAGLCQGHWMQYEATLAPHSAQAAFEACERAESGDADNVETLVAVGNLYRGTGELEQSMEKLRRALALAPGNEQVHAALGETQRLAGQLADAEASFRTAIRLDPAYWRNYWGLARVMIEQGELEGALRYVNRAIELDPDNPLLHNTQGAIYFLQREYLLAAETFRRAIGSHPMPQAYANAGTNYFFGGDYARASAMFEQAVALNPDDYRLQGFLAKCILLEDDGGLEAARDHFERAIELARETLEINPEHHEARAAMALYLATLGEATEARRQLDKLSNEDLASMDTLYTAGMARLALGQTELARDNFEAATARGYPRHLLQNDPRTRALFEASAETPDAQSSEQDQPQ